MSTAEEPPFRTVLVAIDLCHPGSQALRCARSIAESNKATLVIVHCVDPVSYAFPEGVPDAVLADPYAREELKQIEEETHEHGFPMHLALEAKTIYDHLLQVTQDCRANLLILGTRAATVLGRLALGSVAMHLLAHAPCAVLCVPVTEPELAPSAFSEIVFGD